jgi:hypothetical protein
MSGISIAPLRDKRRGPREADRRRAKPYNIVRDISANGSGQWLAGAYLVKAAPREYEGEHHSRQVQPKWDMPRGGDFIDPKTLTRRRGKNEAFANSGHCGLDRLWRDLRQCRERGTSGGPTYRGASCADPGNTSRQSLRRKGLLAQMASVAQMASLA